ncbi:recombinase family protein [Kocuria marina]|uniref:recombinase family protein n=1 Tax=Kocuria marina TaxID=223184 RepID=UPI00345FD9E3
MVGQTVAYVRVSSAEQNMDRQLEAVGECDRIFQNKISGSSRAKRTGLTELIGYVREGDLVKVASMDRLSRDTRDLYVIVDMLTDKGCAVQFVSERITVDKSGTSPVDGLMLGIRAAFAEFERRRIKERQAEGIALAKTRGTYVQAPKLSDTNVEQSKAMIEMGIPKAEVARTFGVSRQTLYTSLSRTEQPSTGHRNKREPRRLLERARGRERHESVVREVLPRGTTLPALEEFYLS